MPDSPGKWNGRWSAITLTDTLQVNRDTSYTPDSSSPAITFLTYVMPRWVISRHFPDENLGNRAVIPRSLRLYDGHELSNCRPRLTIKALSEILVLVGQPRRLPRAGGAAGTLAL